MEQHPDTANEESTNRSRAQAYLFEALQADSTAEKHYAIRSALQQLIIAQSDDSTDQQK